MDIVIIEKREKIGEIGIFPIWEWKFFDAVRGTKIKEWSLNRGFITPKFGVNMYVELERDFRCRLWEV